MCTEYKEGKLCSECKTWFTPEELENCMDFRTINFGTLKEREVCQTCFESMWDNSEITNCESCGEWYECTFPIKQKAPDFDACPSCGHDMVEGYSWEEYLEEHKYSKDIMQSCRETMGFDSTDTSHDEEIMSMSSEEVLDMVLRYEGIIGYATRIMRWTQEICRKERR